MVQRSRRYLKLTMCHQSPVLSISLQVLFNNHGGLAFVVEETKEEDQYPCDSTTMKWLGWQDQRQRRRSTTDLKRPTLPSRPMTASSGLANLTVSSAMNRTIQHQRSLRVQRLHRQKAQILGHPTIQPARIFWGSQHVAFDDRIEEQILRRSIPVPKPRCLPQYLSSRVP